MLLPHFRGRPVALKRFPDGVGRSFYWEKDAPAFTPQWVRTAPVWRVSGESQIHYIVIDRVETLAWVAGVAALELHPFLHRAADVQRPTSVVFDLDPGAGADILRCAKVAFLLRERLAARDLESFVKVSGSKGLQVYVPLNTPVSYGATQPFARQLAEALAASRPRLVVAQMAKALRAGKVFIDWSQNAMHKTTVGVYSLRATADRPYVSLPIAWKELASALKHHDAASLFWEPQAALARVRKLGDLFEPVLARKQKLPGSAHVAPRTSPRAPRTSPSHRTPVRSSRQGGRRRFALTRDRTHYRLWMEGSRVIYVWRLDGLPRARGAVRCRPQPAVEKGRFDEIANGAWDRGVYDRVEGSEAAGELTVVLKGGKVAAAWRFTRTDNDEWRAARARNDF